MDVFYLQKSKPKKPDIKEGILYDSTHMKFKNQQMNLCPLESG